MNGIQLLVVVIGAVALTGLANRRGLPAPVVVVALAAAVSFLPWVPRLTVDPGVILGFVLPPLLYSAALDMSVFSFARNVWSILLLGVGLVLASAFAIGLVAGTVLPGLSASMALILGAVLAPPDAVAATALGRRWGLPRRLMTIMSGESLVNDAAALTLFTVTAGALSGRSPFMHNPLLLFGYGAAVGIAIGVVTAFVVHRIRCRLREPGPETVLGIVVPFTAYLAADALHASGVLAVVAAGVVLGHLSANAGFATRLQSSQVWRTADVVLEAFVFAYLGLQLRFVIDEASAGGVAFGQLTVGAALVFLVLALIRPAWIFLLFGAVPGKRLPWRYNAVLSWAGMRGVVTLAAAAGIPLTDAAGRALPGRSLVQAIAFLVAVATLVVYGATLSPVVRRLRLATPAEAEREHAEVHRALDTARQAARRVTAAVVSDRRVAAPQAPPPRLLTDPALCTDPPAGSSPPAPPPVPAAADPAALRAAERHVEQSLAAREALRHRTDHACPHAATADAVQALVLAILTEQRRALIAERDAGRLDDEVLRVVLEQLDYEEAAAAADIGQRL